ncbi:unnamed protein product [Nyctereutes procyonoides]|uniref:(raccoon dog) hypothetical protein n=1 Tax=Nyctereutes procyonoides TaxID=34880 RepID=A0A811ZHI6_NYCPR|nr:unnamed protein product [Nyctereutes procyonoides]CAD7688186.1 unnamed protein product [Nyctereutes procyonoides]
MSASIYTPKWFLQCFLGWTPFSLTLKLWDAYVLNGERVLTAMAYTILKVYRTGPEEFPTRPLGLEQVSPEPGPLLPSPASETPPRVEEQASPGPATQPEPPGPPPGQAIVQHPPQRWNSLPILPVQQDGAGMGAPDMVSFKTKNGVPFHSAPAWATPEALRRTMPWSSPSGTSITGSPQPPRDDTVGPRTPFLPRGHCSSCPSLGSDGHSQGGTEPLPRGPAQAQDPLPSASTGQLDACGPLGQSVAVWAGVRRLWPAVTVPCLVLLSLPEGGTPRTGHQTLILRDLGWPGPGLCGGRSDSSPLGPALMGSSAPGPWPGLHSGPGLSEPSHSWIWPPGPWACPTDSGR